MKRMHYLTVCLVLFTGLANPVFAVSQTICPIMGEEVNKELFIDVDGKRIYVCCPYCLGEVEKDSAKYIKVLEDAGQTLEDAPEAQ